MPAEECAGPRSRIESDETFGRLRLPVIAAPMFLISSPELVIAAARSGIVGTFPTANCRTIPQLHEWLKHIAEATAVASNSWSPRWAVNMVVHKTNTRLQEDLAVVIEHRVPLVIASVGAPDQIVGAVHGYGGKVICDVASLRHARRAVDAGVDGLILLTSGAGGHEGWANPFAFVRSVRQFYDGPLVLAGCIADGASVAAARMLGADAAYIGTAMMVAAESSASEARRQMMIDCTMDDILRSNALSGMYANFMRPSFVAAGIDPDKLRVRSTAEVDLAEIQDQELRKKRWKDIWSAGQAVSMVNQVATVSEIVDRLCDEYNAAWKSCGL